MKSTIQKIMSKMLLVPLFALCVSGLGAATVSAQGCQLNSDNPVGSGSDCGRNESSPTKLFGEGGAITTITNVLLFIIGAVSVLMIIYGGILYTISGGNSEKIQTAKNTILYAIIGVIVAILAYAIVNFVISAFVSV